MKTFEAMAEAWEKTTSSTEVFLLAFRRKEDQLDLHIEAPWEGDPEVSGHQSGQNGQIEDGLDDFPIWEGCLRVFQSRADAEAYLETVCCYLEIEPEDADIQSYTIEKLFGLSNDLEQRCRAEHEAPLRIDLSTQQPGEFPRSVDTIYTCRESVH